MTSATGTDITHDSWRTVRIEVLNRVESLPSLSSVVVEFLELARREYFTAKDFENVLCKDQALVARLLKVANSGLYGRSRTIHSVPEAVVLIGLESLKKIVFAVSAEGLTRRRLEHYPYHPDHGFWVHSLGIAHVARVLAEASPAANLRGEEAFVAGLLHDVGKLVIDEFLETNGNDLVTREEERAAVGLDHAELGGFILRQWNLPESITCCVLHHHASAEAGEWAMGAAVLSLAEEISSCWGLGHEELVDLSKDLPVERFRPFMDQLGIPAEKWNQVVWEMQQNMSGLAGLFENDPVRA
jgi:putative nucleotidyltransferase with HDIG domain